MFNYTIPQILIHVSAILVLILIFAIARMRNKQRIHYVSLVLISLMFIWNSTLIVDLYVKAATNYSGMIFTNIYFSAVAYVCVFMFYLGLSFASLGEFKKYYYLLLVIPTISNIMLWTNPFHHLFFVRYSDNSNEIVRGVFSYIQAGYAYLLIFLGLAFLLYFSIKNAGFFSKQSMLISVGVIIPLAVDIAFVFKLYSFSIYDEPISFSLAVLCFMLAILKYDFLGVVPIALQTIVDHISDSYIVVNDNFEIIDFNRTFSKNFDGISYTRRKMSIWSWIDQINEVSADKSNYFQNALNQTIQDNKSSYFEKSFVKDQIQKVFAVEITPVVMQNRYKGIIILFKDITDIRRSFELVKMTQAQLIEKEHLITLGQLVGGIAHNLKTPIMSISGGIEGINDLVSEYEESIEDPNVSAEDHLAIAQEMREWIVKMRSYCAYMSDIISTVKGQAVQLTSSTTDKFDLNELLKRIDILMNHELKKYGCKLNVVCNIEKTTMIRGEVNSLVQIVNNLIINAIDSYEGREGVIELSIFQEGLMLLLSVKDYGCGIPEQVKAKLFKEMLTTKAKNGTGLGLYMSYSTIIGKFGGRMWFESEVGVGTVFHISIPVI